MHESQLMNMIIDQNCRLRPKNRKTKPMGKPSGEKTDEEKTDASVVHVGSVAAGDSDKTD